MTRPLVISACGCSGTEAPIVRGDDGLHCQQCGADEAALVRYHDALEFLREVSYQDLAAEMDRRTAIPDGSLSPQICPRCSTTEDEVVGEFSRSQGRFFCVHCSLILPASVYDRQREAFERNRWRARQSAYEMQQLVRSAR